jgi:hypothetical protein
MRKTAYLTISSSMGCIGSTGGWIVLSKLWQTHQQRFYRLNRMPTLILETPPHAEPISLPERQTYGFCCFKHMLTTV